MVHRIAWLVPLVSVLVAGCATDDVVTGRPTSAAVVDGSAVLADLEARHGVTSPAGSACLTAAYDDPLCGPELAAFNAVALDLLDLVGKPGLPNGAAVAEQAKSITRGFDTAAAFGCFRLPAAGDVDDATLDQVCPAQARLILLSYNEVRRTMTG